MPPGTARLRHRSQKFESVNKEQPTTPSCQTSILLRPFPANQKDASMAAKTSRADFEKVFPALVEELSKEAQKYNIPANALEWFQKVRPNLVVIP